MPFKSEKQRRYLHANHPGIAKRWEQEYSGGGIARMGYATGTGFSGLTQEMLDMTYPDQYYKNVIEPAKTGKGPLPSKLNMIKNAGITGPFKAMRIGMDPYLPKSMQAGYDAFRAAPTKAVGTAARGLKNFIGSNIASGLPLGYAALADSLQGRLEDQGLTGEGGIYDVAGFDDPMSAGASVEYDMGTRPRENDSAFLGFERGSTDYPSDIDEEALGMSRQFEDIDEESSYYNNVEGLPSMKNKFAKGFDEGLDFLMNKGTGIRQGLSLANENYLMPAVGGLMAIANRYNPLREGSQNYNKDLQGQVDMLNQMGMLGDQSSPYKITSGPLAGKNLVSGFGTNDYRKMLQKRIEYFKNKKSLTESQNRKMHETIAEEKRILEKKTREAAAAAASQRRAGKGGDHMSRSRSQGGLGISRSQAQSVSDANRAAGMSGWGL